MQIIRIADAANIPKPVALKVHNEKLWNAFIVLGKQFGIKWQKQTIFKITGQESTSSGTTEFTKEIEGAFRNSNYNSKILVMIKFFVYEEKSPSLAGGIVSVKMTNPNPHLVATWNIKASATPEEIKKSFGFLGEENVELPSEYLERSPQGEIAENYPKTEFRGRTVYNYVRLTRIKTNVSDATEVEFFINGDSLGYKAIIIRKNLESGQSVGQEELPDPNNPSQNGIHRKFNEALRIQRYFIKQSSNEGFVNETSYLYLPKGINEDNFDFILNKRKKKHKPSDIQQQIPQQTQPDYSKVPEDTKMETSETPEKTEEQQPQKPQQTRPKMKPSMFKNLVAQSNQDFGGYFSGQIPDYASGLIGTQSVDASQVSSSFGRTEEALQLVNSFAPSALKNIAYIFNFSKGGAYGVYIPALDKEIKTNALKKKLESMGYKISDERGMMIAYPTKDEKTTEQIEEEIKREWDALSSQGGSAIGVNVSSTVNGASQNASSILNKMKSSGQEIPPQVQTILQNVLSVYHLAATIIHEANHSRGGDEGAAKTEENSFRSSAQGKLNEQFRKELAAAGLEQFYAPLELGTEIIHAGKKSWYKEAQYFNYVPNIANGKATGSDLEGRFNGNTPSTDGRAEWSMMFQRQQDLSIEKKLNREFMSPLAPGLSQEHDIIEEQLRKQTSGDYRPNISLVMEEILSESHDDSASYKTTEELLEENRPKPLMLPIKKASKNKLIKNATLFGWYNNLEISDGSTIPGLGDRVMAWEDRDEDFSNDDNWIRNQPRYNPEYDVKGMYFRLIEPRFKPQLWDDMVSDFSNTHPAKRFANKIDPELIKIINVIGTIQRALSEGAMKATRLIVSSDLAPFIHNFFKGKDGIETKEFVIGHEDHGEQVHSVWIFRHGVSEKDIRHSERYFQHKDTSVEVKEICEKIMGLGNRNAKTAEKVVKEAKTICEEHGVKDLYIVGSYAREKAMGENPDVVELDFICKSFEKNLKIGQLLAKRLGVKSPKLFEKSMTLSFSYDGIRIDFPGKIDLMDLSEDYRQTQMDVSNAMIADICNRDFTINMFAYNVNSGETEDYLGIGVKEDLKNGIIKTYIDPNRLIEHNPMIILRALKLSLQYGFQIEERLQRAMIEGSPYLFDGRYDDNRLIFAREKVKEEGIKEAEDLFEEFGLSKIKEIGV